MTNYMNHINHFDAEIKSLLSISPFSYIVTATPNPNNISYYKDLFLKKNIGTIVRLCCEKMYDKNEFEKIGIKVIDMPLQDGNVPNIEQIKKWLKIAKTEKNRRKNIVIHCISGLGRAPLFVCICLICLDKMENENAIAYVRKCIPYAFNSRQLKFLYKFNISSIYQKSCIIC